MIQQQGASVEDIGDHSDINRSTGTERMELLTRERIRGGDSKRKGGGEFVPETAKKGVVGLCRRRQKKRGVVSS